jgi:tetratricopeptide (TPR) repeat protein
MTVYSDLQGRLIHAFNRHDWPEVRQLALQLLPRTPKDAMAPFMAGVAHMELQELPRAAEFLRRATELEPRRPDFMAQYAKSLALMGYLREARAAADKAVALKPADPFTFDTLGVVYSQAHAHEQAIEVFRRQVAMAPNLPPARFHLAYSLSAMGDAEGAERELEACIGIDPCYWTAHLSLAKLRRQTPEHNHVERLRSLLTRYANHPGAQTYLNMALAKEYEDLDDYANAFEHYRSGNAVGREKRRDSARRDQEIFDRLIESFPAGAEQAGTGDLGHQVIFVIGMPRTGTTLLDRILSSHPEVKSAGELQIFPPSVQRVSGSTMPVLLDPQLPTRVRDFDWQQLACSYLEATRPYAQRTPRFIDKMPHNFLYAGFIARALPGAKLVCLRRDPMDACVGTFRHLFEQYGSSFYDYSFDLLDTGRYYLGFDRLMAHWQHVFPGRILEVQYETLIESQEASTRQLLDFCGLPWNDACLHPEQNAAPVNTPNAWQVRAPVYRGALGRWKNYAPQLAELQDLLAASGVLRASYANSVSRP